MGQLRIGMEDLPGEPLPFTKLVIPGQNEEDDTLINLGLEDDSEVVSYGALWQLKRGSEICRLDQMIGEKGALVKIFQTVTDADILWQGKCETVQGYNRLKVIPETKTGDDEQTWQNMVAGALPARLKGVREDGSLKEIFGYLSWSYPLSSDSHVMLVPYGSTGHYVSPRAGDELTVFTNVRGGEIAYEGRLHFDHQQRAIDIGPVKTKHLPRGEGLLPAAFYDMANRQLPIVVELGDPARTTPSGANQKVQAPMNDGIFLA